MTDPTEAEREREVIKATATVVTVTRETYLAMVEERDSLRRQLQDRQLADLRDQRAEIELLTEQLADEQACGNTFVAQHKQVLAAATLLLRENERLTAALARYERQPSSTGAELIAAERLRHAVIGYTPEYDLSHNHGELIRAAMAYLDAATDEQPPPRVWPFDVQAWHPSPKDRARELAIAGSLIAAEIDRLRAQRQADENRYIHLP